MGRPEHEEEALVTETEFRTRLSAHAGAVENLLESVLSDEFRPGEIARPERLMAAMRHGALGGGKRLRPFLVIETAALFGVDGQGPLRAGAALECIHCYSLVHDDLPAMDDDDLRRGRPTVHRAFDEATAILAGDSLLTLAFDILTDPETSADPAIRAELAGMLAQAAGPGGMAGGQMLDLMAESEPGGTIDVAVMQSMKTGALFRFACEAGALLGGAEPAQRENLRRFGSHLGAAFQLADDILDVTASTEDLGKRAAKDAGRGKATLVAEAGVDNARASAQRILDQALDELAALEGDVSVLEHLARFAVSRES